MGLLLGEPSQAADSAAAWDSIISSSSSSSWGVAQLQGRRHRQEFSPVLAAHMREISIQLYQTAADYAATRGIIIADTKFEFGVDRGGRLVLADEVFTPDSSRYWPADQYAVGSNPPSYDKQFLRDWLETAQVNGKPWDKTPPSPRLPREVIDKTAAKYQEALTRLMG